MRCPYCNGKLTIVAGGPIFPPVRIEPKPPSTAGADVVLDEHHPTDDGHGDDGDLLAGP